jgi:hypothetical protein
VIFLSAAVHVVVDGLPPRDTQLLDYVPLTIACIAAVSAYLSLIATRQAKHITDRALLPELRVVVDDDGHNIELIIANASKTLGADVGWAVLWTDRRDEGRLAVRYLGPDSSERVKTGLRIRSDDDPDKHPPRAIVWCRDLDGYFRVWSSTGAARVLTPRKVRDKEPVDLLGMIFDDAAHNVSSVTSSWLQVGPFA